MTIAEWHTGDLERFMRDHLRRPEVRRGINATVPTPTAPTFATGWTDYGAPYRNAGYYKDRNRVYLSGGVKNTGSGTGLVFTLPADFRPAATRQFPTLIFGGTGSLSVASTGAVTDLTFSAGSKAYLSLDGISFEVA